MPHRRFDCARQPTPYFYRNIHTYRRATYLHGCATHNGTSAYAGSGTGHRTHAFAFRVSTPAKTATPALPPPTPDPYAGWYYKPVNKGCMTAPNTRIEGAVYENGILKNGVRVRVSHAEGAEPSIDDSITGMDPTDYKHAAPEWAGRYGLSLYEGQQNAGNWWVFVIDNTGNQLSPRVLVTTQDGGGGNTATVDFRHWRDAKHLRCNKASQMFFVYG